MPAVSFSSPKEAEAAFSLGPVRFACLECESFHWSHAKGWERCARQFCDKRNFRYEEYRSGAVFLRNSAEVRESRLHPWVCLGREAFFRSFYGLFGYGEGLLLGRMPALLALNGEIFGSLVDSTDLAWWEQAAQKLRGALEALDSSLPPFPGPAAPLPAFESLGYGEGAYFSRWAVELNGSFGVTVHHYSGLAFVFRGGSPESSARGAGILFASLGAPELSVRVASGRDGARLAFVREAAACRA